MPNIGNKGRGRRDEDQTSCSPPDERRRHCQAADIRRRRAGATALCDSSRFTQRTMDILFVADPLEVFKTYKDTTFAIMEFARYVSPTLVTRDAEEVRRFHAEHQEIILKPLDGMGGMGIFRVGPDGLNLGSIVETLNRHGSTTLMVQRFVPEIAQGDK